MALHLLRAKVRTLQHRIRGSVTYSTAHPRVVTVGIDFGCKNSRVAIVDSLIPKVLCGESSRVIPSYVTFIGQNSFVPYRWGLQELNSVGNCFAVGEVAKRKMWTQPSGAVYNIKRMIGKQFNEPCIQEMKRREHFCIVEGPGGEACVEIHGMRFSPVEITNIILAKLKDVVLLHQCHDELQAVISVPSFFDKQQKEDIMSAGYNAGLKVLQLIDEPVAAALSSTTVENGTVAVFGMGAGSYSATILHVSPDANIEIITHTGDPSLGGDEFDNILVDHFVDQIARLHSIDIRGDKYAMMMLTEVCEQVKVELSSKSEFTVSIPAFPISAQGILDLNITISRIQFEKLVDSLIEQIKIKCQSILKDAKMSFKDIDEVILIGGMTRVPKIQNIVSEVFGKQNTIVIHEEAVVIGSAVQAALHVEEQDVSEDMIPLSIGIKSEEGGTFTRVIPRRTVVPTKKTVKIPRWCGDGGTEHVSIYIGEHVMVEHNLLLGEVEVINSGSSYQNTDVELSVEVNKDFVISVSARNADDQGDSADGGLMSFQAFQIKEHMCKRKVGKAVKKALLDWRMHEKGSDARLRNLARLVMNTLDDALSIRKDELPGDLSEDAVNAWSDLQKSLYGDADVLKDMLLTALKVESLLLSWKSPSESLDSGSDSANDA